MAWFSHYAYFLVCALTVVIAILASLAGVIALLKKPEASKDTIQIKHINTLLEARKMQLQEAILSKDAFSAWQKEQKKLQKSLKNSKKNAMQLLAARKSSRVTMKSPVSLISLKNLVDKQRAGFVQTSTIFM